MALLEMAQRLYDLQDPLPRGVMQEKVVREYLATEESYLRARADIPPGDLAELRFQDLVADPVGEMKRIYRGLNLPFSETLERRLCDYLSTVQNYTPNVHPEWTEEETQHLIPLLDRMIRDFRHDQPTIPAVKLPQPANPARKTEWTWDPRAAGIGLAAALACAMTWIFISSLTHERFDWFVWPTGIAVGYSMIRAARAGSKSLGLWAAFLTLLVLLCVSFTNTQLVDYAARPHVSLPAALNRTARKLTHKSHLFWSFMGLMTAYRLGSRPRV
jgi:hypothetical protein